MRALNPRDINKLISIKGIVIRCSDIYPEMKDAVFECEICGYYESVLLSRGFIEEPAVCGNTECKTKNAFKLIHNLCKFTDK
jgi:DNA replication licensing factor MCM4